MRSSVTARAKNTRPSARIAAGRRGWRRLARAAPNSPAAADAAPTATPIAANYILQLSSLELQDVINQELEENPALGLQEVEVGRRCGNPLTGRVCLNCFGAGKPGSAEQYNDSEPLEGTSLLSRDDEDSDEFDPVVRAEAEQTLAEYLSWNVRVLLPKRLHVVAEYLIGNLNENGYLEGSLEDAAAACQVSLEDVERVLDVIQSIEPW